MRMSLQELPIKQVAAMCEAAGVVTMGWRPGPNNWVLRHVGIGGELKLLECRDDQLEQTLLDLIEQATRELIS